MLHNTLVLFLCHSTLFMTQYHKNNATPVKFYTAVPVLEPGVPVAVPFPDVREITNILISAPDTDDNTTILIFILTVVVMNNDCQRCKELSDELDIARARVRYVERVVQFFNNAHTSLKEMLDPLRENASNVEQPVPSYSEGVSKPQEKMLKTTQERAEVKPPAYRTVNRVSIGAYTTMEELSSADHTPLVTCAPYTEDIDGIEVLYKREMSSVTESVLSAAPLAPKQVRVTFDEEQAINYVVNNLITSERFEEMVEDYALLSACLLDYKQLIHPDLNLDERRHIQPVVLLALQQHRDMLQETPAEFIEPWNDSIDLNVLLVDRTAQEEDLHTAHLIKGRPDLQLALHDENLVDVDELTAARAALADLHALREEHARNPEPTEQQQIQHVLNMLDKMRRVNRPFFLELQGYVEAKFPGFQHRSQIQEGKTPTLTPIASVQTRYQAALEAIGVRQGKGYYRKGVKGLIIDAVSSRLTVSPFIKGENIVYVTHVSRSTAEMCALNAIFLSRSPERIMELFSKWSRTKLPGTVKTDEI